jgi:hypothetical protein
MNKIFKKLSIFVIAFLVVISLSACVEPPVECGAGYEEVDGECELIVIPDETAPVISGMVDIAYTIGDDAPDYNAGLSANDDVDGDLTGLIAVDSSLVDLTVAGTYVVTVTVTDDAGNTATETYNVIVSEVVYTNEELALMDLAAINLDPDNLVLPSFTANGSFLYWSSSDPNIITNRGFIIPPPVGSDPAVVTLTCRVVNGGFITEEDYNITVDPFGEVSVTNSVELPFYGTSEEYVVADKPFVELFYVNNGTVPYIDIETYINMLDGAIEASELMYTPVGEDVLEVSYDVSWEDFDGTIINDTYTAVINFTDNTFAVDTFDFFGNYVADTSSDYGDGLNYIDAEYVDSNPIVIPLGEYNFDIITYADGGTTLYLMPLAVTNLLFAGNIYYDAYYNGDAIYGIDTFSLSGIDQDDPLWDDVRVSSLNTEDMSEDMKWASYNFLALAFDYFYGLKEDHGVDTHYDLLSASAQSIITGSDSDLYNFMFDWAYGLDDLHSWHIFGGYYNQPSWPGLSINDLGPKSRAWYEQGLWAMDDLIEAKYGSAGMPEMPNFELLDNDKTAVVHITGFTIDTPDEFKATLDSLPASVENVVIDLSDNTGGNVGAVFRIFGYMTESAFTYHSQNPTDGSAVTIYIESDYVAYDYNWYIVSSKVSFSAANLMISMAKENGIATIMGQKSSGGASSIGSLITPDGSVLMISTLNVLSTRIGNEVDGYEYVSVEYGIEPDYIMVNPISDVEIVNIIQQDQAE